MNDQLVIDHETARREADLGMARSLNRAEREKPGWSEVALEWLKRYAEKHAEFPGFFVTAASQADPTFPKAKGQAWGRILRCAQERRIVVDSGKTMPHPKRHACKAIVWRSLVFIHRPERIA